VALASEIRCGAWASVAQASDALILVAAGVEVRGAGSPSLLQTGESCSSSDIFV
jgi:hypothetical protein